MENVTDTSRRLAAVVSGRLTQSETSVREASRLTGIPMTTLTRRLTGLSPFDLGELDRIASMFGVTVGSLVAEAESGTAA